MIINDIFMLIEATQVAFSGKEENLDMNFSGLSEQQILNIFDHSEFKKSLPFNIHPIEYFILLCAVAPHIYPPTFNKFYVSINNNKLSGVYLGGEVHAEKQTFYPTIETVIFLLNGFKIKERISMIPLFEGSNTVIAQNLIQVEKVESNRSFTTSQLIPTGELFALIRGLEFKPKYGSGFPASLLETKMEWEDLILPYQTLDGLNELKLWMKHRQRLEDMPELSKKVKPGYRVLFHGPSGTGKTLTASLIGKAFNLPVYRVDLSMVVSKWVGETEKNLKQLFDVAENKNWILFFDEADSIFGKRTQTNSSNDKYANQEVSYLLQRVEDFPGLVILASNLKSNMDAAFNRRFQATITFPMPDEETRYSLWCKAFPKDFKLSEEIDLWEIARKYELAGGAITNIIRFCSLKAFESEELIIQNEDLKYAITREFRKTGKSVK
ncbi:ATP-binding protein [Persicobacter sp. CCB-QB2]|uniref:ATP-binding protein n=1 Tax=Persicobacter sp. CCB-QB2 TaxID=1561025 RepID=UPI0006A9AC07|nr:ATP-binding protein [Persicobacter sp. CCB-QB2]